MHLVRFTFVAVVLVAVTAHGGPLPAGNSTPLQLGASQLLDTRCEDAQHSFDSILGTEPDRLEALYGRGLARLCRGDFDGAIGDLTRVTEKRPDDPRAALDLGTALTSAGRYADAEPWLRKAAAAAKLEGQATLLLGFGQLQRGELEAARRSFAEARRLTPELYDKARYYDGLAAARADELTVAEENFRAVADHQPHTPLGTAAERLADAVGKERAAELRVHGTVGFEYDSNVALAPTDEVLRDRSLDDLDDGRFTLAADLRWLGLRSSTMRVEAGYSFFQSFHFRLDDFDLQSHRPDIVVAYQLGRVTLGLDAHYDFFLRSRSFDPFEHQWTLRPSATLQECEIGETQLYYRLRGRKFSDDDFEDLDGDNHSIGLEQGIRLGDDSRRLSLGYAFDTELLDDQYRVPSYDPADPPPPAQSVKNEFAYDGHEAHLGATAVLPLELTARAHYAFRYEDYGSGSTFIDEDGDDGDRNDLRHTASLSLSRPIWEGVRLGGGYYGAFNRSNNETFTYDRHVGFVTISAEF